MASDLKTRIEKLGRLVAEAHELGDVGRYYTELASFPPFRGEGVRAEHTPIKQLVRGVAASYDVKIPEGQRLLHLPRYSLWHGSFGGAVGPMAVVIYFDEQNCGVACFGTMSSPQTWYVRFSLPEHMVRDPNYDPGELKIDIAGVGPRGLH